MYSNFKIIIIIVLCTQLTWSQEREKDTLIASKNYPQLFLEIAYTQPVFYGDNFINKGYDINSTIDFGFTIAMDPVSLHLDVNVSSSEVIRPDLIGNIRDANFTRISAGVGYPLDITSKWQFIPSLHLGYLKIGQLFDDEKIRDDGVFINAEVALHYRAFKWIDVSIGAKNHFDFIRIDAPSEIQSFFNNAQSVYPFIGLRFFLNR